MKVLFVFVFIFNFGFAIEWYEYANFKTFDIKCKGTVTASGIWNLPSDYLGHSHFEDGMLYQQTSYQPYFLNTSSACGGDSNTNILVFFKTDIPSNLEINNIDGFEVYKYNSKKNLYYNNTILVNDVPCVPNNLNSIVIPIYKVDVADYYNRDNIGFSTLYGYHEVIDYRYNTVYDLTEKEISKQKNKCSNNLLDELEPQGREQNRLFIENDSLLYNASINTNDINNSFLNVDDTSKKISTAFNSLDFNTNANNNNSNAYDGLDSITNDDLSSNDNNLNESINTFISDYSNILDDSFTTYADVFGFGGYGARPNTISFNLLGKKYDVFNADNFDPFIDTFRNTFLSFAYLWGFLIVIKDFK